MLKHAARVRRWRQIPRQAQQPTFRAMPVPPQQQNCCNYRHGLQETLGPDATNQTEECRSTRVANRSAETEQTCDTTDCGQF